MGSHETVTGITVFSLSFSLSGPGVDHGKLGCVYDNHCHVYTSTEGRKFSSPRHFKMRNGLCRLLFSTKQMLPWHI